MSCKHAIQFATQLEYWSCSDIQIVYGPTCLEHCTLLDIPLVEAQCTKGLKTCVIDLLANVPFEDEN